MECYETTTATGEGFWGKNYHFKLIRRQRHYTSRFSQQQREIVDYALYFQEPGATDWERRIFAHEDVRAFFIARSIGDLHLTSVSEQPATKTEGFLVGLIGENLSSVTFVMDYVQMGFNNHHFNFYNRPVLYESSGSFSYEQDLYPHKLISLIGQKIKAADEFLDVGLGLEFESGAFLSIPLRPGKDFSGPEFAEYFRPDHQWTVWSAGDPPFE